MASTMFYYSKRCLILVDYNEKRMQSNGDDLIFFGKYRGHFLHEILKIDPFLSKLGSIQVHSPKYRNRNVSSNSTGVSFHTPGI